MTKPVLLSFVLVFAPAIQPQQERGSDAAPIVLANDKLELAIGTTGGRFSKIVLRDGEQLSPLAAIGHFLALDGFGAPSDQERALGMPFHGEASRQPVKIVARRDSGPGRLITMQIVLPLAQETLTRTVESADGENIIYVTSRLESALTVDRPVSWAEHATIGPPFMEAGKVNAAKLVLSWWLCVSLETSASWRVSVSGTSWHGAKQLCDKRAFCFCWEASSI